MRSSSAFVVVIIIGIINIFRGKLSHYLLHVSMYNFTVWYCGLST